MNREITRDRQPMATAEVAAELRSREAPLTLREPAPPRPGDVFLSRRTAELPVEWLVLDAEAGRVRVVVLDDHPYAGSRDLELPSRSLGGAAVLRCDLDAWVDASELEAELRTGVLATSVVEDVRRKRRAIDEETLEASLLEEEVDGDPAYRQWREDTLRRALEALTGVEESVAPVPVTEASSGWGRWYPVLIAAAAILVLAAGWQIRRLSRQLDHARKQAVELQKERRTLEERLASSEAEREASTSEVGRVETALREVREASERALAEQTERWEARLRRAFDESVVVNVPSFVLGRQARTRAGRGQAEVIEPGGARRLTLSLEVVDPSPFPRYRLRVVEKVSGEEVWRTDELVKVSSKWLRLDLPTDLFEAREYELRLYGLGAASATPLEECYTVRFER